MHLQKQRYLLWKVLGVAKLVPSIGGICNIGICSQEFPLLPPDMSNASLASFNLCHLLNNDLAAGMLVPRFRSTMFKFTLRSELAECVLT